MGKLTSIKFDCENPVRDAIFWAAALDGYMTDQTETVVKPEGPGPIIEFHQAAEPKTVKSRVHLDVVSTDPVGDIFRMQRLGAKIIAEHAEGSRKWTVLQDPEGVEFCVVHGTAEEKTDAQAK